MQNLNKKNKRAISSIVASIVIVFLSIAALGMVWKAISPAISVDFSPQVSCLQSQFNNQLKINSACFDSTTNKTKIRLERGFGEEISELNFVFFNPESDSFICTNNKDVCSNCEVLGEGQTKDYFFMTKDPKSVSIKIDKCAIVQENIIPC